MNDIERVRLSVKAFEVLDDYLHRWGIVLSHSEGEKAVYELIKRYE